MSTVTITARPAAGRGPAPPPRTAFVLAGGAALGAMQAGMVRALYERGIVPDLLIGTSAGALNAAPHRQRRLLLHDARRVDEPCAADIADLGEDRGHRVLRVVRKGARKAKIPLTRPRWRPWMPT